MRQIVEVRLEVSRGVGKCYDFYWWEEDGVLLPGDVVVLDMRYGRAIGTVVAIKDTTDCTEDIMIPIVQRVDYRTFDQRMAELESERDA